jgi:AcrR family transcriptional regulator
MGKEKEARVIEAASAVFLKYGFRKTTMGDIAQAAGISRPALYLLFCNKERIFEAVLRRFSSGLLEDIRRRLQEGKSPRERLRLAFDLWAVKPFEMLAGSPEARELADCGFAFAAEALAGSYAAFEELLVAILEEFPAGSAQPGRREIAHVLAASVRGFKGVARSAEELRGMIDSLLSLTEASLRQGA